MPATTHQVDRLSLTFRAAEAAPPRSVLPGGWWLWCLLGIGVGLGGWLISRHYLAEKLGERLLSANSRPEAMLALEGLLLLDSTASNAIVVGLQHEDFVIARAAFRAIDSQIQRWEDFTPAESSARMISLAQSLRDLPDSTPPENLILASSLASRIFTLCLEREDEILKPTMQICELVIQRVGKSALPAEPEERLASLPKTDYSLSEDVSGAAAIAAVEEYSQDQQEPIQQAPDHQSFENTVVDPEKRDVPPPLLPPATSENSARFPQLLDSSDRSSLPIDTSQPLSSTGGRASLRLINSPTRSSTTLGAQSHDIALMDEQPSTLMPPQSSATDSAAEGLQLADEPSAKTLAGIEQLPIQELVRLLASVQPKVAQAATLALRRHGMSDSKLELAMQLATGTEELRLDIIEQFPKRTDIDPRVWLLWMAQDGQTEVRARSVAQLSSMLDNDVMRELRLLLNRERDPEIAQMIRKLLMTR